MKMKLSAMLALLLVSLVVSGQSKKKKNLPRGSYTSVEIDLHYRTITTLPPYVIESSGLAVKNANEIWTLEDSGNANELYRCDTLGNLLRILKITNASNVDWEDMATDSQGRFYISDAGNNNNNRKNLVIYRIPNPDSIPTNFVTAEKIQFAYEDQTQFPPSKELRNYDMEAIIWRDDTLFLFTKNRTNPFNGYCRLYKLPALAGNHLAQLVDSVYIGPIELIGRVTAADVDPTTGELVLLTSTKIVSFSNYPGNNFFQGNRIDYNFTALPGQVEGLAFVAPNRLYMSSEGYNTTSGLLFEITFTVSGSNNILNEQPLFQLFPNPATNYITIESNHPDDSRLLISDLCGRFLYDSTLGKGRKIGVSGFRDGLYIISLLSHDRLVSRYWIKQ